MAKNIYEAIMTRNGELAKFFDDNYEIALMVKKLIGLLANIANDWRVDASTITFPTVMASPDGKMIVIHVKRKQ